MGGPKKVPYKDPDRAMAERTTILQVPVGSTIHGLHLEGTDDRDEMGVCVEDLRDAQGFHQFEQYIYRTAAEREGKHDAPSQPGDLDLTIYSLRKFLRLALQGNPTVLTLLFVPTPLWIKGDARGAQLQELAPFIISRQAGKRYLGYLESQRMRLLGEMGSKRVNRSKLEEKYGFDTKYAMHMLRLAHQGIELLETGSISLPIQDPVRAHIRNIRLGKVPLNDVLNETGDMERRLKDLITDGPLPAAPDTDRVEEWMLDLYLQNWKARDKNFLNGESR